MSERDIRSALVLGGGLAGGYIAAAFGGNGADVVVVDREDRAGYLSLIGSAVADCRRLDVVGAGEILDLLDERAWDAVVWCLRPGTIPDYELAHVVSAAAASGAGGFVYLSSLAVYGSTDDGIDEAEPPRPTSGYGKQKVREEDAVFTSQRLPILILRLTGLFGAMPDPASGSRSARAVAAVVQAVIAGEAPVLRVERHRDQYLYGGDLAGVLQALLKVGMQNLPDVVNVGPGYGMLPDEAKAQLEAALSTSVGLDVVPDLDQPVGVLDTARLRQLVPVEEWMGGFQSGVRETYNFMMSEVRS